MSITALIIIVIAIGSVFSGILLLKQSAKKFDLTEQQLKDIEKRNKELAAEEKKENR